MNKDIQSALLRACARFIGKKVDPITQQVDELRTQVSGTVTKEQLEQIRLAWEDRLAKPEVWLSKEHLPAGPAGEPGRDADPIEITDVVAELLGTDGLKTIIDLHVAAAVAEYFEANPIQHGKDGATGEKGDPGDRGEKGLDGADGVGLAGAMINRDSELVVTTTRGEPVNLGRVVGSDGAPGQNGRDGADFTEVEIEYDGERGLTIRGKGGEIVKCLPIPIYIGYWREGTRATKNDIVTEAGTAWIALKHTEKKPGLDCPDDWAIFARKGRDGAQGEPGRPHKPAEPVKLT